MSEAAVATGEPMKLTLKRYLQSARDTLVWKLEGLDEFDVRRPLTSSGTNLLGIVKHVARVEIGYFTNVFGRTCPVALPWFEDGAEPNADMWATADESRQSILDLYRRSWEVSDATIDDLDLSSPGCVPWWSEAQRDVTLHTILVHMIAETARHAGHADILREQIDGIRGWSASAANLPNFDSDAWRDHRRQIERSAMSFRSTSDDIAHGRPIAEVLSVVLDTAHVDRLVDFWSWLIGGEVDHHTADTEWITLQHVPVLGRMSFQRVDDERMVKNRVHLDLDVADLAVATGHAVERGATVVGPIVDEGTNLLRVMRDPEGNEFCFIARSAGHRVT